MWAQLGEGPDVFPSGELGEATFSGLVSGERDREGLELVMINAVRGVDEDGEQRETDEG